MKCRAALLNCTYHDEVKRKTRNNHHTTQNALDTQWDGQPSLPGDSSHTPTTSSSPLAGRESGPRSTRPGHLFDASNQCHQPTLDDRVSGSIIGMHVHLFIRWMFPIWPILRPASLLQAWKDLDTLSPRKYCLLLSLCAATNIQLNLAPTDSLFDPTELDARVSEVYAPYKREYLLSRALHLRGTLDIASKPDIDTLLTSCFLFSAYANLEKQDEAWFYLSQTVSFVVSLRLNDETRYSTLSMEDAEMQRRIYWFVFVLERCVHVLQASKIARPDLHRAYCLHNRRPVMLQAGIGKPGVTFPDDPGPIDGFLGIIYIFESIPIALYNWLCTPHLELPQDVISVPICFWSLSDASLFPVGANETQLVNNAITQQWLRSYLWHIALRLQLPDTVFMADSLPLEAPLSAAKSVMSTIASVSQRSMEVHGIGMVSGVHCMVKCDER